jgi:predicted metal-dependent HD superfamily phosphohydrolase
MATKDHQAGSDKGTLYLLDFDLAILGENLQTYAEYVQKIRAEYALYPDFLYNRGRKKVLQHFLDRDTIFKTREFIDNYESQARENLKAELKEL